MGEICVEDKGIVFPGQVIAKGMDYLPGSSVYREGEDLVAMRVGLVGVKGRLLKITPLSGAYLPKDGDLVIGRVTDITMSAWRIDIGWAYAVNLSVRDGSSEYIERGADLHKYYDIGDYVMVQITNVMGAKLIDVTMKGQAGLRRLGPGKVLQVTPAKVPRIIGRQGSMITLIKEHTQCRISVGQNGVVWLSGEDPKKELLAVRAIEKIEAESHISGLTDRIKEFLEKEGA